MDSMFDDVPTEVLEREAAAWQENLRAVKNYADQWNVDLAAGANPLELRSAVGMVLAITPPTKLMSRLTAALSLLADQYRKQAQSEERAA